MIYASFAGGPAGPAIAVAVEGVVSSSILSCLIGGSSDDSFEEPTSSISIFLLLPFGAGSSGVRQ